MWYEINSNINNCIIALCSKIYIKSIAILCLQKQVIKGLDIRRYFHYIKYIVELNNSIFFFRCCCCVTHPIQPRAVYLFLFSDKEIFSNPLLVLVCVSVCYTTDFFLIQKFKQLSATCSNSTRKILCRKLFEKR